MELETESEIVETTSARFVHKVGHKKRRYVQPDEVVAFEANQKYVDACLTDGTRIILDQDSDTIKALTVEFTEFVLINRGILVRRSAIQKMERLVGKSNYVVHAGHFVFQVSRRCVTATREAFQNELKRTASATGVCGCVETHASE